MPTNLQPASTVSAVILPSTGTLTDVDSALAYGIYTAAGTTNAGVRSFISGAVDQVAYVYNKLGGAILDIEIKADNVYNAYEEACLEYSYIINTHQAKNVLSELLGHNTGSFNQDGEFDSYSEGTSEKPNLKFPSFRLDYLTTVGKGMSSHAGIGANERIYSASFDLVQDKQDYDLQDLIYSASLNSSSPFYNKVGKNAITIQRVYYKSPVAMWNFFGGYTIGAVGNLSTYGMYADDSNFQLVPAWQNILQAY